MKITRFEEIEAWKLGRELANQVYTVGKTSAFAKDFGLRDQELGTKNQELGTP